MTRESHRIKKNFLQLKCVRRRQNFLHISRILKSKSRDCEKKKKCVILHDSNGAPSTLSVNYKRILKYFITCTIKTCTSKSTCKIKSWKR